MSMQRVALTTILAALLLLVPACGGSSDSPANDTCAPPFSDALTGIWVFQEVLMGDSCATNGLNNGTFTVTQSGNTLTFIGATVWSATLCGTRASANGSFSVPTNGGLHTVTRLTIQFQDEGRASGTTTWTWANDSGTSCSGTSTFDMAR